MTRSQTNANVNVIERIKTDGGGYEERECKWCRSVSALSVQLSVC